MSFEEDYLMAEVKRLGDRVARLEEKAGVTQEPAAENPFAEKTTDKPVSGMGSGRGGGQRRK